MTRTPKALLLDLDYTVLPTGDLATTPVIEAVAKASRLIPVAIASGSVQDVVCHIGLMTLQVSNKGAKLSARSPVALLTCIFSVAPKPRPR